MVKLISNWPSRFLLVWICFSILLWNLTSMLPHQNSCFSSETGRKIHDGMTVWKTRSASSREKYINGNDFSSGLVTERTNIILTVCGKARYGEDALLTIKSVLAETNAVFSYNIFTIVTDKSPEIEKALLTPLSNLLLHELRDRNIEVHIIPAMDLPIEFEVPFGKCASQRLFYAENPFLAYEDAVLHVDTDTIILQNPWILWSEFNSFLGHEHTGMATESNGGVGYYRKRLSRFHKKCARGSCECKKVPCKRFYGHYGLNSGVMLMNLTRIRRRNFQDRIKNVMRSMTFLGDQDVLNHLFAEKDEVHVLPCKWNIRSDSYCNILEREAGILHGSRGIFHKVEGEGYFPLSSLTMKNYTSQYDRIRNLSWIQIGSNISTINSRKF